MNPLADSLDSTLPNAPRLRRTKVAAALANPLNLQPLPRWAELAPDPIRGQGAGTLSSAGAPAASGPIAVLSPEARAGAALFALDQIIRAEPPWLGALRMRLALQATVASARLLRVSADEAGLRDADHLTRTGDDPGPAGRIHRLWRRFALRPARLAGETVEALAVEAGAKSGAGEGAAEVLALMQADADIAALLGWARPVPLAATVIADPAWREGRERRPFRVGGEGWEARRMAVVGLAATRAMLGREISRDTIARLKRLGLLGAGPRLPQVGAALTYVTTQGFLEKFGMNSLRDLPENESAGVVGPAADSGPE